MALLDILTFEGATMENSFSRGNGGVLVDINAGRLNEFALPSTGGSCDYPSENDVRSGISFSTYTGNLELPTEADVRLDTQYGTNGTEFTGELVAGGGGSNIFISLD
jgi:hypothetical protein